MAKDKGLIGLIVLVAIFLLIMNAHNFSFPKGVYSVFVDDNTKIINWNGYETTISSSTAFIKTPCQGYPTTVAGYVTPNEDSNGTTLSLQSISQIDRGCSNGATTSANINLGSPSKYKTIFIPISGSVSTSDYKTTITLTLSQEGGNSLVLGSKSVQRISSGEYYEGSFPSSLLFNFDGSFITIPSTQSTFKIIGDSPIHLSLTTSSNAPNRASSTASISISPPEVTLKEVICSTVYSPVCVNGGITYPNSCLALQSSKTIISSGECPPVTFNNTIYQNNTITLRPDCNSCPTDTFCIDSGENVACVKKEIVYQPATCSLCPTGTNCITSNGTAVCLQTEVIELISDSKETDFTPTIISEPKKDSSDLVKIALGVLGAIIILYLFFR